MICTQCGWELDEATDCHCSGCGKWIRGLVLTAPPKRYYNLFYGGRGHSLSVEIEHKGQPSLTSVVSWELVDLQFVGVTVGGSRTPIWMAEGERTTVELQWNGRGCLSQTGKLLLYSGIRPPLELTIVCSPLPNFRFSVNGQPVRNGEVTVVTTFQAKPELVFAIELHSYSEVVWDRFRLYLDQNPEKAYPIPLDLKFPETLVAGVNKRFTVTPEIPAVGNEPVLLSAHFQFGGCDEETFIVELVEAPRVVATHHFSFIGDNALIPGVSPPKQVNVTLENHGGLLTEVLQVRSLSEPWLTVTSQPDNHLLRPGGESQARFSVLVDASRLLVDDSWKGAGKLILTHRDDRGERLEQVLPLEVELKRRRQLTYPIAVDLGNNSTCVAFPYENGTDLVCLDEGFPGKPEFPTIIEFERYSHPENGEGFIYGHLLEVTRYAEEKEGPANFQRRVWSFKPLLKEQDSLIRRYDLKGNLGQFTGSEIITFYLKEVIRRFERISGYEPKGMALTYPAGIGYACLNRLKEIAQAATGLEVITEISEPEALALHHFRQNPVTEPTLFAVFDFGGGTTDISIGRVTIDEETGARKVSILTSVGMNDLGGDLLSFRLAKDIYEKAAAKFPASEPLFPEKFTEFFNLEGNKLANFLNIMHLAEGFKKNDNGELDGLAANELIELQLCEFYSRNVQSSDRCEVAYGREDFDSVVLSEIRRGFDKLNKTFAYLKETALIPQNAEIGVLILGGNSSRLSFVKDIAAKTLGLPVEKILFDSSSAKTSVALGAAWYGRLRRNANADVLFERPDNLLYPLGVQTGNNFKALFPLGSGFEDKPIDHVCDMRVPEPFLNLYWNFDPSEAAWTGNPNIEPAAEYSLAKYKTSDTTQLTFQMKLTRKGIEIKPATGDHTPDLIPLEF